MGEKLENTASSLERALSATVFHRTQIIAGDARALCPVESGSLRLSIEGFSKKDGENICGGAKTNNEYATYVEFGTGPVGTQSGGHPLDSKLGIVRSSQPWLAKIPDVGWRFVHGQKANAFMYFAMKQNEKEILEEFSSVLREVISND